MLEGDLALNGRRRDRVGALGNDVIGVENGANTIDPDGSLGNGVGGGGQVFHRLEELAQVRQVNGKSTDRHHVFQDQSGARATARSRCTAPR